MRPNLHLLASGGGPLQGFLQGRDTRAVVPVLRDALSAIQHQYEMVVFDCGPSGDVFSIAGYAAATEVAIVATTDRAGADGLEEAFDDLQRLQERKFKLRITAVVPTMYDASTRDSRYWLDLYQKQIAVTTNPIRVDVRLREQPRFAKPIYEFAPDSRGAEDYTRLVRRILYGT